MNNQATVQAAITDQAYHARQLSQPKLNPYPENSPEHAAYEVGWSGLHLMVAPVDSTDAIALAERINAALQYPTPEAGTKANGWFGGFGCRWCAASRAWFTTLPFEASSLAYTLADLFHSAGCKSVTVTNSGGVSEADGGLGIQISARV